MEQVKLAGPDIRASSPARIRTAEAGDWGKAIEVSETGLNQPAIFLHSRANPTQLSLSLWPSPIISISRNPLDLPERLKSGRNFFPLALPEVLKVIYLTFSVFRTQSNELVTILGSYIFILGPFPPVSLACLRWNPKKWPENVLKPFLETYSSRIYPRATCRVLEKTRCY